MRDGLKKNSLGNRCLTIKTKKMMKKNLFMVAAVALIATVSCNKELENNSVQGPASDVVFVAELEQPNADATDAPAAVQTKTSLGSTANGVTAVNWVKDDKIKINGVEFTAASAGSKTNFTTTASFNSASTYNAVYPATAAGASDLSKVTIPASQKGTFAEAAISVAKSSTQSLSFKNVASILKFQVPSACSTITIESTSNLAGTFPVTFSNDLPVIGTVSSGSKKITLTGSFTTGKDYYVAVLPGSHKFTVRLDRYLSKASTTAVTTKRAVITNLKTLPALTASGWVLKGIDNWSKDATMYKEGNWAVAYNIKSSSQHFKFYKSSPETWVGGNKGASTAISTSKAHVEGGDDIKVPSANTSYDFYYCAEGGMYMIVPAGSSIDNISVDTDVYLRGNYNNWGNGTTPTMHDGKFYGWKNVKFASSPEFKFSTSASGWDWQHTADATLTINVWKATKSGSNPGGNTKYGTAGTYDIYLTSDKLSRNKVVIVKAGDPIPAL